MSEKSQESKADNAQGDDNPTEHLSSTGDNKSAKKVSNSLSAGDDQTSVVPSGGDSSETLDKQSAQDQARAEANKSESFSPWSLLAVFVVFAIGLGFIITLHWRKGSVAIGGAAVLAGILRWVLPPHLVGLLKVRAKAFDVTILLAVGITIMVLGMVVPGLYVP